MKSPLKNKQILLTVLMSLNGTLNAAEIKSEVIELDEVVITATKINTSLSAAPAAVTIVTVKDVEKKNASRLGDVLEQVPSLYLRDGALGQSQGTSGTSGLSLRGVDQSRVLILLDGQPLQDGRSGKVNWRIPFVEDIARVEIVPGAFSSLYGSNAIGGVVNIISKQPDKHEFTTKIKKGWGDASGEDASIYFREKLEGGWGFAGGVGYQNRDSYVNDFVVKTPVAGSAGTSVTGASRITTRDGAVAYLVGDKGTTPWRSANAIAKLFYNLDVQNKVFAGIGYQDTQQGYTQFNTYLRNAAGAPVSSGTLGINGQRVTLTESNFVNNSPLYETATRYFAGYDGIIGQDYALKIDLAKIERSYGFTMAGTTATWNGGAGTLYDTPNAGADFSAQLNFPLGAQNVLVTGVALHRDYANQHAYTLSNWRNVDAKTALNTGYTGNSVTTSFFAQDELSVSEALKIYLGGRFDRWETQGDRFQTTPASTTLYSARNASAFSPKLSGVYALSKGSALRASVGKSFRAPTNEDMYTSSTIAGRTTEGDPNLQPEHGVTWELGGETRFTEHTKASATYYETELTDLIYLKQVSTVLSQRINAAQAQIHGIEFAMTTRLTNWLEVAANYAYIQSKMLENSADPLSVGKRLTDSPQNIAGIELTAEHGAWSGMLSVRAISHVFMTAQNTDVVEGVPGSYDAYTLVNSKLGYAFSKQIKGTLAVNNLLNQKTYSYFLMPALNVTAGFDFYF
ncbi:MAG: TonB-dependent receptor [Gallionellaceae bacterium]